MITCYLLIQSDDTNKYMYNVVIIICIVFAWLCIKISHRTTMKLRLGTLLGIQPTYWPETRQVYIVQVYNTVQVLVYNAVYTNYNITSWMTSHAVLESSVLINWNNLPETESIVIYVTFILCSYLETYHSYYIYHTTVVKYTTSTSVTSQCSYINLSQYAGCANVMLTVAYIQKTIQSKTPRYWNIWTDRWAVLLNRPFLEWVLQRVKSTPISCQLEYVGCMSCDWAVLVMSFFKIHTAKTNAEDVRSCTPSADS